MKKIFSFLVVLTLAVGGLSFGVHAESDIQVVVDSEVVNFPDAKPFIQDNRTLVPVRFVSEALGAKVGWNGQKQEVEIKTSNNKNIKLIIGKNTASVDGNMISFDSKSILKDSRTFVPLRFISETMGADVQWEKSIRSVYITTDTSNIKKEIVKLPGIGDRELNIRTEKNLPIKIGLTTINSISLENGEIKMNQSTNKYTILYIDDKYISPTLFVKENTEFIKQNNGTYEGYYKIDNKNVDINNAKKIGFFNTENRSEIVYIDNPFKK